jgi:hypothetical protein
VRSADAVRRGKVEQETDQATTAQPRKEGFCKFGKMDAWLQRRSDLLPEEAWSSDDPVGERCWSASQLLRLDVAFHGPACNLLWLRHGK